MSRRSSAIALWAILRSPGRSGIELVYRLHKRELQFEELLNSEKGFHVLNEVVFNQVLIRCDTDELTDRVLREIQEIRECWVGGSSWEGRGVIRICVCSRATTEEDVKRSVASFKKALEKMKTQKQR